MTKNNSNDGVFVQAGILAAASIAVRIIGLLYRSPLTAIIGDEGNGYYGTAYNIYTIILLISSYSVPSAISKVMAEKLALEQYKNAQRVFYCALAYALMVGAAAGLFLFFGAGILVPERCVPVLRVFAPTIFVFGILGVLRGYFQARRTMVPTSVSQILEQIANAVVSIGAAWLLMRGAAEGTEGALRGAVGSALGTGSGVVIALIFMLYCFRAQRGEMRAQIRQDMGPAASYGRIMKETMLAITPFILSSFILNLTTSLNQTIFLREVIQSGTMTDIEATTIYRIFSNKAVVITNIPISIATAVAAAIIPGISTAYARMDMEETKAHASNASRITLMIAIPCAAGLMSLAMPVVFLLFPQRASAQTASQLLALLAVTVVFYSVSTVTNAVLQAIGKMHMPLVSAGIALVVQTALLVLLLKFTDLGIYSLVLVSVVYSVLIFLMNEFFLQRYLGTKPGVARVYGAPVLAAALMGAAAFGIYQAFSRLLLTVGMHSDYFRNAVAIVPAILAAIVLYFFLLIRFKAIGEEDFGMLPKGRVLVRLLKKLRWL